MDTGQQAGSLQSGQTVSGQKRRLRQLYYQLRKEKMSDNIPQQQDSYITDFISGQRIKATPEEIDAVQVFAKQLVEDYFYSKKQIQTRPQWRVKARPSDIKKEYPIDIAVFSSEIKTDDNLYIVVECKKKDRKDGISQLQDYLRFSKADIGVWFNGNERAYIKKSYSEGKIYFEEIPNIPRRGQRLEDIGKFKRKDLKVPHNLKSVFNTIRNTLAGNAVGTTRDEILAQQLINLIFCKIYDERFTKPEDIVSFRAGIKEKPEDVKKRIDEIFEKVKSKYKEVLDFSDHISLDPKSTAYVVGELQNFSIIEAQRDAISDAFETFIGYALKGEQGQFFTPRNVIKLVVEIIDPKPNELIIDPACGSGGFLVESLRHIWKKLEDEAKEYNWSELALSEEKTAVAIHNIRGIEKDDFLSKVAKAYMAIIGDGKGGIFCEDSLDKPINWKPRTQQNVELGKFDVVLTNPPFGKKIKVVGEEKLNQYELAYKWKNEGVVYQKTNKIEGEKEPQVLFIERCLQLLKNGGRLGIVLPETFFHAPKSRYIMQFIEKHNITWIIDLPHNTFRPHNNAKCLVIILEKNKPQQEIINMAVAEEMGHDHQGKEIYRFDSKTKKIDTNSIWDDIPLIIDEFKKNKREKYTFSVEAKKVSGKQIYVPRYYWQAKDQEIIQEAELQGYDLVSIQKLINEKIIKTFDGHGSPPSEYKGTGNIAYVRVKDIVNWELYKDPTSKIPEDLARQMRGSKNLAEKDIVYVRRGSYRIGSVAMVSPYDINSILTREILVLRVIKHDNQYGINPYYLLYLLSHRLVSEQTKNKILIETTLPNIADRWKELKLPIKRNEGERKAISERIRNVIENKWEAIEKIEKLKEEFGDLTT